MGDYIGFRADAELQIKIDQIAEIRFGGNRSAALAAMVKHYIDHVATCSKCGTVNPDKALFCMKCGLPLTEEVRARLSELKQAILEHPDVIIEAVEEIKREKSKEE